MKLLKYLQCCFLFCVVTTRCDNITNILRKFNWVKSLLIFFQADNHHLTEYPTYHTLYDNFNYVTKFIDPDFRYHTLIAKIWLLYTLEVADARVLPFNITRFADKLFSDVKILEKDFLKMTSPNNISLG